MVILRYISNSTSKKSKFAYEIKIAYKLELIIEVLVDVTSEIRNDRAAHTCFK